MIRTATREKKGKPSTPASTAQARRRRACSLRRRSAARARASARARARSAVPANSRSLRTTRARASPTRWRGAAAGKPPSCRSPSARTPQRRAPRAPVLCVCPQRYFKKRRGRQLSFVSSSRLRAETREIFKKKRVSIQICIGRGGFVRAESCASGRASAPALRTTGTRFAFRSRLGNYGTFPARFGGSIGPTHSSTGHAAFENTLDRPSPRDSSTTHSQNPTEF